MHGEVSDPAFGRDRAHGRWVVLMYVVYILKSKKTDKFYIGQTNNLEARLKRHNNGNNKSTKAGIPWSVVYHESCPTRSEAFRREQQIKSYKGGVAFKKLVG